MKDLSEEEYTKQIHKERLEDIDIFKVNNGLTEDTSNFQVILLETLHKINKNLDGIKNNLYNINTILFDIKENLEKNK